MQRMVGDWCCRADTQVDMYPRNRGEGVRREAKIRMHGGACIPIPLSCLVASPGGVCKLDAESCCRAALVGCDSTSVAV